LFVTGKSPQYPFIIEFQAAFRATFSLNFTSLNRKVGLPAFFTQKKQFYMKTSLHRIFIAIIGLIIFTFSGQQALAQDLKEKNNATYTIIDQGGVMDVQPYILAMDNSDFRYQRLLNKRNTIVFQTGLKIELFSATEIAKKGLPIVTSEYPQEFPASHQEAVFAVAPNNFIIEYHTATGKQFQTK
jgi:hypothetical protein